MSRRIKTIALYIKPYKKIVDVGCDHGYLILEAFENCHIDFAQAIDNKPMPLKVAINNITKEGLSSKVVFTLSDGLTDVWDDVEVAIISGIGGFNIISILEKYTGNNIKRFILQANRNNYDLRKYIVSHSMDIVNEDIIYEDNKYYEIIICEPCECPKVYTNDELRYGPMLLKKRSECFIEKMKEEKKRLLAIDYQSKDIKEKIYRIDEIIENEN